jgi:hypothetical protein
MKLCKCGCGLPVAGPCSKYAEPCRIARQKMGGSVTGKKRKARVRVVKDKVPVAIKMIPCLTCGRMFGSEHKGNRICPTCLYRTQNDDSIGRQPFQNGGRHGAAA